MTDDNSAAIGPDPSLLLVDDDEAFVTRLGRAMERRGFAPRIATSVGMAREMVLGLEYVLPDGTLVTSLNKMIKNNAGYDLKQLFIGSEGTLGIVTAAVLKLFPRPRSTSRVSPSWRMVSSLL